MKILVVAKFFPAQAETFILEQVNSLIEQGHDVQVLVLFSSDSTVYGARSIKNKIPERIIDGTTFALAFRKRLVPTLRGVLRCALKYPNALNIWRHGSHVLRGQIAALADQCGEFGSYDMIYAAFGPSGVIAECMRDVGLLEGPIVTNFLGYDVTREIRQKGSGQYRRLFDSGALFLPNSSYLVRRLHDCGAPAEKTKLHRLGVDVKKFSFVDRSDRDGIPRAVAVGRMVEKKGFEDFLYALGIMKKAGTQYLATVVGDGPLRPRLEALRKELDLEDVVTFVGWCRPDQVMAHLELADINVVPSVTAQNGDEEGLPLTIVEASARGLPSVGTIHSGIPEIIRDGETGLLVEERDRVALAESITSLCLDPEGRLGMGRAAHALVAIEFNSELQGERLSKLLFEASQS